MIRHKRMTLAALPAVTLTAATLIAAAPTYASGRGSGSSGGSGSGGGGGIAGGGTSSATFCPFEGIQDLGHADWFSAVEANGAGCVVAYVFDAGGGMVPYQIIAAPGWTFEDNSDPGSPGHFADNVDVRFTQPATGDRVEVIIQPGKTEVK